VRPRLSVRTAARQFRKNSRAQQLQSHIYGGLVRAALKKTHSFGMKPGSSRATNGGAPGRATASSTAAYAQWHQHPIYDRYWRYHERAVLWLQQHAAAVRRIHSTVADRSPDSAYTAAASYRQTVVRHCEPAVAPSSALTGQEQYRFARDLCSPAPPSHSSRADAAAEDDDDVEFQVTPELVAFLAHSHQHRKQRGERPLRSAAP